MSTIQMKRGLWHNVGRGVSFSQLGNPRQIEKLQLVRLNKILGNFISRSNLILIPNDERPAFYGGPDQVNWADWIKFVLITPVIPEHKVCDDAFFICSLSFDNGELKLYCEPRRVRHGPFLVRLTSSKHSLFILGKDLITLSNGGMYGGGPNNKPTTSQSLDIY